MMFKNYDAFVEIGPLEQDERVDELQRRLGDLLIRERAFLELSAESKAEVKEMIGLLESIRFSNRKGLEKGARSLVKATAPELERYVPLAVEEAGKQLSENKGVLVIYTGGTVGSAPKNKSEPDSPQIVRPWSELKNAAPQLGLLGYPVDAVSFVEPLDSCNVGPVHWRTMAEIIREYFDRYAGFVILHGTDSLVYTASALSFMLVDLSKPVVITGSQVAGIVNPRNDAHQNMITAIMLANPEAHKLPPISEVIVSFGNLIVRGNRAKKISVVGYQGFRSPNYPLLGEAGEFVTLDKKQLRSRPRTDLQVFDRLETNVIMLEVFPGMQDSPILRNILSDENLKGVVLKSYGAGNIPTDPRYLRLFADFIDKGGIVVNVTSVPKGEVVMGLYETSQVLQDRGILGGFDLTPEAAMCKLMMLLGTHSDDPAKVRKLMQQSIAGEQTLSLNVTEFADVRKIDATSTEVLVGKEELQSVGEVDRIEKVMLRFMNAEIDPGRGERAEFRVSLDDGHELLRFKRGPQPENVLVDDKEVGESVVVDLTHSKHLFVRKDSRDQSRAFESSQKIGLLVELVDPNDARFSWEGAELNIYFSE